MNAGKTVSTFASVRREEHLPCKMQGKSQTRRSRRGFCGNHAVQRTVQEDASALGGLIASRRRARCYLLSVCNRLLHLSCLAADAARWERLYFFWMLVPGPRVVAFIEYSDASAAPNRRSTFSPSLG
jgi:hypothetical protein